MVKRHYWIKRIEEAWERRSIIWLSGVRRVGKTSLSQNLEDIEYFDCELPRTRRTMEDPEDFLKGLRKKRIVLDEVHRLSNPSELLKIAADHFKDIKVLATGSSTLQASMKFRDTLTGRKEEIWLTPMNQSDLEDFQNTDDRHRLHRGGLPPFFLEISPDGRAYQEWMDSYWAKDVQELFHLERRSSFQKFLELLFINSGGIFEATKYAAPCEISRTTIANYLNALEATRVVQIIRPFSSRGSAEIISAPKVYTFDTGFVCYYRGWDSLRPADLGGLWEHYVLNEFLSRIPAECIRYWRDKQKHEIDFILTKRGNDKQPTAVECKWKADAFDLQPLKSFRSRYPDGENWVVASDVERTYQRNREGLLIQYIGIADLVRKITS